MSTEAPSLAHAQAASPALPWPEQSAPLAAQVNFQGWRGYLLANEFVRIVAVPDIGGRVMALDLRGDAQPDHSFIWFNPDLAGKLFTPAENQGDGSLGAWKNYGGDKTWPAPQGWESETEWHGPPDAVLDSGLYRVEEFGERYGNGGGVQLHMVSAPDARTGLQISRHLKIVPGSSRVELLLGFHNASPQPVRWSIWDVIQLNAGLAVSAEQEAASPSAARGQDYDPSCVLTAPLVGSASVPDCSPAAREAAAGAPPVEEPYHVMFGSPDNTQWRVENGLFYAHYQWQIGKVGIRAPGGWVAFNQGSQAATFVARFAVDPTGVYPDGGSNVECWTVGGGQVGNLSYEGSGIYHMEAEVLSPLHTIASGREVRFAINWALCRCSGPVLHTEDGGCSVERLSATRAAGAPQQVRLRGRFGVFDAGRLELGWIDSHGRRLASQVLGVAASPLNELVLDQSVVAPAGAVSAELWLRAPNGVHRVDCCVF